jgi:hypothetical protein
MSVSLCCSSDFRTAQRPVKPSATASVGVEKFGRWPRQFAKKGVKKMTVIRKAALVVAVVVFAAVTATPANNAEQVVFSDTGALMNLVGNGKATTTPFGFWIWCSGSAAPGSNGGYQNANACQGSMYFYNLETKATGVIGQVTEGTPGIYTMHIVQGTAAQLFSGTLNPAYTCTLTNTTPNPKGPGNTVQVSCIFMDPTLGGGLGTATDTGAVVNVTGPH